MDKTVKSGPTLSQILLSVVDKTVYLGGNVRTRIHSNRRQLGPQAKTLLQLRRATPGSSRAPPVKPESRSENDPLA